MDLYALIRFATGVVYMSTLDLTVDLIVTQLQ